MKRYGLTALIACMIISCLTVSADNTRDWTAVGDDGTEGLASGYIMAVSQDSALIVAQSNDSTGFDPAVGLIVYGPDVLPVPSAPGTTETFSLTGLTPGIWFASVKAFDEVPNYALLGNIHRFEVKDEIAPAAILNLQ